MSGNRESMIERVARAVLAELQDQSCTVEETANMNDVAVEGNHFDLIKVARAAIEAMREPSEAMLDTMAMRGDPEDLKWVYRQMIDAALAPTGPDDQSGDGEADHG